MHRQFFSAKSFLPFTYWFSCLRVLERHHTSFPNLKVVVPVCSDKYHTGSVSNRLWWDWSTVSQFLSTTSFQFIFSHAITLFFTHACYFVFVSKWFFFIFKLFVLLSISQFWQIVATHSSEISNGKVLSKRSLTGEGNRLPGKVILGCKWVLVIRPNLDPTRSCP